ncbi:hypothetical protein TREMEDRAFT_65043 [Tremella mesenterica DSM 1558]|uniref:uncharacterized protein n=1 Tax=Tremella mesenterica (strain ATCC 24925 / CBS 8224 / DSM 1558 / NBRC 9311 / NRRL Y-6157 / RJB 2259-6 / UBC 559-6) TaxID=578456 RepID=UPI00032C2CA7|nr:uncharacterized protein TREMEDRAFT_65043 [Tremella mesenterica DSM 1558]EIW66660.1 hypothetical protein TREMEDRAFT_65043 [Tremella mesenterica DSM 1558]
MRKVNAHYLQMTLREPRDYLSQQPRLTENYGEVRRRKPRESRVGKVRRTVRRTTAKFAAVHQQSSYCLPPDVPLWRSFQPPAAFEMIVYNDDVQARWWVLKHNGNAPPHFTPPHNSWLTKVRSQHRLSDDRANILYWVSKNGTEWYKVVPMSQVVIKHIQCLHTTHSGQSKTYDEIARHYGGIGRKEVIKVVQACNICMLKVRNKDHGGLKPIISHQPPERIQIDLVDMRAVECVTAGQRMAEGLPHVVRSINFTKHSSTLHTPYQAVFGRKHQEMRMWETLEGRDEIEEVILGEGDPKEDTGEGNEVKHFQWESNEDSSEGNPNLTNTTDTVANLPNGTVMLTTATKRPINRRLTLPPIAVVGVSLGHTLVAERHIPLLESSTPENNPIQQIIEADRQQQPNPSVVDRILAQMQAHQVIVRQKMVKQYGRKHKRLEYSTGDKVTLFVPELDCPGAPASRIPCVVCEVFSDKPNTYQLLCSEGVLSCLYRSKFFIPADDYEIPVELSMGWSKWEQQQVVTLRDAAYKIFERECENYSRATATERTLVVLSANSRRQKKTTTRTQKKQPTVDVEESSASESDTNDQWSSVGLAATSAETFSEVQGLVRHQLCVLFMSGQRGINQPGYFKEHSARQERVKTIVQAREVFRARYGKELAFDPVTGR